MDRPLTRPKKPYCNTEIYHNIQRHFVTDQSPRCMNDNQNSCLYGKTGCGIGFMFTQKDADFIDRHGALTIKQLHKKFPGVYKAYFTDEQLPTLILIQKLHDGDITVPPTPEHFQWHMKQCICAIRSLLTAL